jgi:O-antigen ligase
VLLGVVLIWYIRNLFKLHGGSDLSAGERARVLLAPFVPLVVIGASFIVLQLLTSAREDLAETLHLRIASIGDLLGGTDESAGVRTSILAQYFSDLMGSPMLGLGPDYATNQIAIGAYGSVSQNSWLEWAIRFGIPYTASIVLMLFLIYRLAMKLTGSEPLLRSYARLLLLMYIIVSFSMVDLFWMRQSVCALGVLLGVLLHSRDSSVDTTTSEVTPGRPLREKRKEYLLRR